MSVFSRDRVPEALDSFPGLLEGFKNGFYAVD